MANGADSAYCDRGFRIVQGSAVATSKSDTAVEYANYGRHCLRVVRELPDQDSRMLHREMAAEWFRLADQAAHEGAAPRSSATLHVVGKTNQG
jgi:hypothetical protein